MSSFESTVRMKTPTGRAVELRSTPFYVLGLMALGGLVLTSAAHIRVLHLAGLVLVAASLYGAWRELGQLRHALAQAHQVAAWWQSCLHGSRDSILVLERRRDPMGRFMGHVITQGNARAHQVFARQGQPLVGSLLIDAWPVGLHPSFHERLDLAWSSQEAQVDEHALPGCDEAGAAPVAERWLQHQIIPCGESIILVSRDTSESHRHIRALREQETFYRTLVDSLPLAVFARSKRAHNDGTYVVWNRKASETMRQMASAVLGRRPRDILPLEVAERGEEQDAMVVNDPRIHHFHHISYPTPAGERWVDLVKAPVYGADGQLDHILSLAMDVTEQKKAAEQLRLASRVVEEIGDAVVVSDSLDRVLMVNPAFLRLTGLQLREVQGKDAELLGMAALRDASLSGISAAVLAGERWCGESPLTDSQRRSLETWLSVSTVRDDKQRIAQYIRVFSDISVLKAQQRELAEQARRDSLTGLPNRRVFGERLRQALTRARRDPATLAVMYVDLDGFKSINDRLGHAAGDQLLIEVARRLESCVRASDCVCRLAGDEFTLILEGAGHPTEVERIAQRILDRLALACHLGDHTVVVSASLGAAVLHTDDDLDSLCERADAAMYQAKHAGKQRFVLAGAHPPHTSAAVTRLAAPCSGGQTPS